MSTLVVRSPQSAVVFRTSYWRAVLLCALALPLFGCDYVRLLRPSVLKQLNPRVVRMVNYLPEVDDPNEAIIARLFAHGGLSHADLGSDGIFRDRIYVPTNEYVWQPAIIVMRRAGELELEFHNNDESVHIAFLPSTGERETLLLPVKSGGRARIRLDQPGLYWFGCPIANHAGRGMLGLVIVEGDVPAQAKLDRPRQPRP
ncbi:MAG: MSMEG_3727 family PQQ-associated protein [Gemmatimonadaceae bacterium]